MTLARHVVRTGYTRNPLNIFPRKSQGKKPFWRPKHRRENNIKTGLRVGAATVQLVQRQGYELDDGGSSPGRGRDYFLLSTVSRPALGPTQPPIQ